MLGTGKLWKVTWGILHRSCELAFSNHKGGDRLLKASVRRQLRSEQRRAI